jgi:hypothetical protein
MWIHCNYNVCQPFLRALTIRDGLIITALRVDDGHKLKSHLPVICDLCLEFADFGVASGEQEITTIAEKSSSVLLWNRY